MNIMETPAAAGATWSQGLTFRRNFAEISVFFSFPLVTGIRNFGIFRYISFQNSKFNKFRPKSTEIRRNSPKFRNEIPFQLITGISPENEIVNPAWSNNNNVRKQGHRSCACMPSLIRSSPLPGQREIKSIANNYNYLPHILFHILNILIYTLKYISIII